MPRKSGKTTPNEKAFIDHMAVTGDRMYAAEKAGYADPASGASRALQRPAIQDGIRREQLARLNNELLPLAISTLADILTSKTATERGKLTATAQVLKHTVGANIEAGEGKEPHEMSASELQQRIDALRREASERARPVIEGEAVALDEPTPGGGVFG